MASIWWVLAAFLMGGSAGLVGFSLIGMARRECEHAINAQKKLERDGALSLYKDWMGNRYWSASFE